MGLRRKVPEIDARARLIFGGLCEIDVPGDSSKKKKGLDELCSRLISNQTPLVSHWYITRAAERLYEVDVSHDSVGEKLRRWICDKRVYTWCPTQPPECYGQVTGLCEVDVPDGCLWKRCVCDTEPQELFQMGAPWVIEIMWDCVTEGLWERSLKFWVASDSGARGYARFMFQVVVWKKLCEWVCGRECIKLIFNPSCVNEFMKAIQSGVRLMRNMDV